MPPLRYFFYRGDLCKSLHISRPNDTVLAWNYPKGKAERYVYSDVRTTGGQAFTTKQVGKFINRSQRTIKNAIQAGNLPTPQRTYGLDSERNGYAYYWSEEDIVGAWDYFRTVHHGRPRNDGQITPLPLPTLRELRAMVRQGTVFYAKVGDDFVPTWRAENI